MIQSPSEDAAICNECIGVCVEAIEDMEEEGTPTPALLH
jgi:hypothetical protein